MKHRGMVAMRFESRLAARIARRQKQDWPWKKVAGVAFIVFIILTLTASTSAASQAVIQLSNNHAYAKYLGAFDGKMNTVVAGVVSDAGWLVIKIPFRGALSDLQSISFSEFLVQTGGTEASLEPYVVIKLPRAHYLVCYPNECYSNGEWSVPYFNWQIRDPVAKGNWIDPSAEYKTSTGMTLDSWESVLGDPTVIQVLVVIGNWDISSPYRIYLGDLSVNGALMDLSNAKKLQGTNAEFPLGF